MSVVFSLPLMQRCLLMRRQTVLRGVWETIVFPAGCVMKASWVQERAPRSSCVKFAEGRGDRRRSFYQKASETVLA